MAGHSQGISIDGKAVDAPAPITAGMDATTATKRRHTAISPTKYPVGSAKLTGLLEQY